MMVMCNNAENVFDMATIIETTQWQREMNGENAIYVELSAQKTELGYR
jgi:hypothetical protein